MRKILSLVCVFSILILMMSQVAQAKEDPQEMLQRVTQELVSSLRQHDQALHENPQLIYKIIDQILVPHVDWKTMSQWVIGRQAWNSVSPQQQNQFSAEFKDLLIRTYASTLRAYNNQTIEYLPVRGGVSGRTTVQISSRIKEPGREPIKVAYRLVDKGDSWKVYDISIEGVSLLKGFQAQFAEDIRQEGMDGLIRRLHQHNEKPLR